MRRSLAAGLLLSAALASPALAQTQHPTFLSPLGYQQYTSLASATSLTSIPVKVGTALFCAETAAIRWRDDGTAPTSTIGMPLAAGQCMQYYGNLAAIQFIGSGATLDVSYYK